VERLAILGGVVAGAASVGGAVGAGVGALLAALPPEAAVLGQPAAVWLAAGSVGALVLAFGGAAREGVGRLRAAATGTASLSLRRHGGGMAGMAAAAALPGAFAWTTPAVAVPGPAAPSAPGTPIAPLPPDHADDDDDCVAERAHAIRARLAWARRVAPDLDAAAVDDCHATPSAQRCWAPASRWDDPASATRGWLHLRNLARADGPVRLAVTGDFAPGEDILGGDAEATHLQAWRTRLDGLLSGPPPAVIRFAVGHDPKWEGEEHVPSAVVHGNGALAGTRAAQVVLDMHNLLSEHTPDIDLQVVARVADHAGNVDPPRGVDRFDWDRRIEIAVTGVPGLDAAPECQQ
jgi:hypothetical protein